MKRRTESRVCKCGATVAVSERQCMACKRRGWREWYHSHRGVEVIALRRAREKAARRADPRVPMLRNAKQRAKRAGVPFDITVDDIVIPATCPVLGVELKIASRIPTDNSPSLDRLLPAEGYVRGNVAVISFRANAIKNSASATELLAVADWLNRVTLL